MFVLFYWMVGSCRSGLCFGHFGEQPASICRVLLQYGTNTEVQKDGQEFKLP
jgi:hypothetical protein